MVERIENCICGNVNVHTMECKHHRRDLYLKNHYKTNKEEIERKKKIYEQTPKRIKKRREHEKQRRETDQHFYISSNLRSHFSITLKRFSKTGKVKSSCEYGIDFKAIIKHLTPFPKDIKNYHVDHIIPLSLFDFNNPKHINIAFTPGNHQWLTIKENLEKNNKLVMPHYNHNFQ